MYEFGQISHSKLLLSLLLKFLNAAIKSQIQIEALAARTRITEIHGGGGGGVYISMISVPTQTSSPSVYKFSLLIISGDQSLLYVDTRVNIREVKITVHRNY